MTDQDARQADPPDSSAAAPGRLSSTRTDQLGVACSSPPGSTTLPPSGRLGGADPARQRRGWAVAEADSGNGGGLSRSRLVSAGMAPVPGRSIHLRHHQFSRANCISICCAARSSTVQPCDRSLNNFIRLGLGAVLRASVRHTNGTSLGAKHY